MQTITGHFSKSDLSYRRQLSGWLLLRLRKKLLNRWLEREKSAYWSRHPLIPYPEAHARITSAITGPKPFAVGRLGQVEASILMWAEKIPDWPWRPDLWPRFSDTAAGATNAGIRPRNRESYRAFADLAWEALDQLDLHGVWSAGYEAACLPRLTSRICYSVETITPDVGNASHWMLALEGKKVLVVSPFAKSIRRQIPNLSRIWAGRSWSPKIDFELIQFPYLIDEGCPETWWEVYNRIGTVISGGAYDVALLGCGGLGLPFAALAKQAGRCGIQMGGHLQLLFGIYGRRHLEQEWHRKLINEAWIRPDATEVPETARRVEGGCYW